MHFKDVPFLKKILSWRIKNSGTVMAPLFFALSLLFVSEA